MEVTIANRLLIWFSVATIILGLQVTAHALENEDDSYLESMIFGEIPDVFSAIKISQNLIQAPASINVFSEYDIERSGARTLGDLLKYVPGIYVTNTRSGFDLLKVRGSQDRYNYRILLIIDGIPRRELFLGYTSISELVPVENIEQIEVIRGPGSALYGTNAYTGVISIYTKTAEYLDMNKVDAGYGEFNTQKLNIAYGKKLNDDFDLAFNGRYLESDGYEIDRGRDGFLSSETTDKKGHNLDLKLNYKDFSFIASLSSLDYSYPWSRVDRTKDREEKNTVLGIQYDKDITEQIGINVNLYLNSFDFREDQTKDSGDESKTIQENSILGIDAHIMYELSHRNQLILGAAAEKEDTGQNEEMERSPGNPFAVIQWIENNDGERNFSLVNHAIYLEDIWQVHDQVQLTLGLRYDNYEQYGDSLNPRIGAVYTPIKNMLMKILYGEAFRGPTYKELFIKELDGGGNVVPAGRANPQLDAEKIKTTELEISYAINNNLLSKIRYFHNNHDGAITSVNSNNYENIEGIETYGYEIELEFYYEEFSGFINGTFLEGESNNGTGIDGAPDYQVNAVLNYSPTGKFDSRLGVRFISERDRPIDYHDDLASPLSDVDNLGSYFDVELSLIYHLNDNWSIASHVYNLFDDENYNPSFEPGSYWDIIHPGRAYFLNLTYRLPN